MKSLILIFGAIAFAADGSVPTDYKTAYSQAQSGDKPLLVLVTAEWCPPCRMMKSTTIPSLMRANAFEEFNFATVDLGTQQNLARKLIGGRGVPQLILFEKHGDRWERRYLSGMQSVASVKNFMDASQSRVRMAQHSNAETK